MGNKNPLIDFDFLKKIDLQQHKTVFTKIILLNFQEEPIEELQGRTTGGNISVDGSSSVRRTCSISLVANELNIHQYYWGIHSKIKIYMGLKNEVDSNYDDIIWFPMGIFLITSFNTQQATNNYTISISGKDKMCMLNGDLGGNIMSLTYDFGTYDMVSDDGTITNEPYLIHDIILSAVHEFCQEPYQNIIIKDLDDFGLELMEYHGKDPIYFLFNADTEEFYNVATDSSLSAADKLAIQSLDSDSDSDQDHYYYIGETLTGQTTSAKTVTLSKNKDEDKGIKCYVSKYTAGDVIGYKMTDLTYAGDLIGNVGDSLTNACLDKIKTMLGDFEYFYNLDGQFVFQKKPSYVSTSWNPIQKNDPDDDETYTENAAYASPIAYSFQGPQLISSIQNTPNLLNIKNDFAIWGTRTSSSGNTDIPIHLRYAIDKKPTAYIDYTGKCLYYTDSADTSKFSQDFFKKNDSESKYYGRKCDWREIIYQMASDYQNHNNDDNFISTIRINNPEDCPNGYTGYEQYYTDIYSFWRSLYWPEWAGDKYKAVSCTYTKFDDMKSTLWYYKSCIKETYSDTEDYYYLSLYDGYVRKDNLSKTDFNKHKEYYYILTEVTNEEYDSSLTYYQLDTNSYDKKTYWIKNIEEQPESINFWFDFLDDNNSDISKYSVRNIGDRPKAENDDKVTAIYFKETPDVILVETSSTSSEDRAETQAKIDALLNGYNYIQIPDYISGAFELSSRGKNALEELDSMLYDYAYCAESITITCFPIYYLQPNTRIFVYDEKSGINGEYIIDKLNYSLTYNGMMTITATKAVKQLK